MSETALQMNQRPVRLQVHRFDDCVAITVANSIVYVPRREAVAFSRAIHACTVDIAKNQSASNSIYRTFRIMVGKDKE